LKAGRLILLAVCAAVLAAIPAAASAAPGSTVWLCKPGLKDNPCEPGLKTTVFDTHGNKKRVIRPRRVRHPKFDCFYVYPTVSNQQRPQATKSKDPELKSIALYQAARYSQLCRVYAPVYRQITIAGLFNPSSVTPAMRESAYQDVVDAWHRYLSTYNHGRGVVLIGHSQGTFILRRLVSEQIDPRPSIRKRLISAILLGGNVLVKQGSDAGGDFKHIPACRSAKDLHCVIAFSTFDDPVPSNSLFGRTTSPGKQVLCTNPAALGGGSGKANVIYPRKPFAPGAIAAGISILGQPQPAASTPWISFPGAYRAACSSADGADVLQITPLGGSPKLHPSPDATWGLHLVDANIELGNLIDLVRREAANYLKHAGWTGYAPI
jgi:hypothetical protein